MFHSVWVIGMAKQTDRRSADQLAGSHGRLGHSANPGLQPCALLTLLPSCACAAPLPNDCTER